MSNKVNKPIKGRVVTALAASIVTLSLSAQAPSSRPNLVVGVMIDGLSMDYL